MNETARPLEWAQNRKGELTRALAMQQSAIRNGEKQLTAMRERELGLMGALEENERVIGVLTAGESPTKEI